MIGRRPFWLAWTAFVLLGAAWAVALPVNGTYDESAHIARAYSVYRGQWRVSGEVRIPESLLPINADCTWAPRPARTPASCQQWVGGERLVAAPGGAAHYPPLYYLLVGAPLRLAPGRGGIIASRLLSVVASAVLLAAAVAVAARSRLPMLVAAIVLALTPMVFNLIGAINPNGLEISAAVCLFVVLLCLFRDEPTLAGSRRTLLLLAGVAAWLLITLRPPGPLLFGIDVLAVAVVLGPRRLVAELLRRDARLLLVAPAVAGAVVAGAWLVVAGSSAADVPRGPLPPLSTGQLLHGVVTLRRPFYIEQLVGRFSYGETRMSHWAIDLWYVLVATAMVVGLWRASPRVRLTVAALVLAGAAILVGLELSFRPRGSWYAQGRYVLPVLVGAVLVAAWAAPKVPWQLPVGLVLAAAPVHLYALARVMVRFRSGGDARVSSLGHGSWRPPMGTVAPLACAVVGVLLLLATVPKRRATT